LTNAQFSRPHRGAYPKSTTIFTPPPFLHPSPTSLTLVGIFGGVYGEKMCKLWSAGYIVHVY
jgi:hypothetical protein